MAKFAGGHSTSGTGKETGAGNNVTQHGFMGFGNDSADKSDVTADNSEAATTSKTASSSNNNAATRSRWGNLIHVSCRTIFCENKLGVELNWNSLQICSIWFKNFPFD